MMRRIARGLIAYAAHRRPPHQRTDVRREWLAETAILKDFAALRFAVSLALTPVNVWHAVRFLFGGPVVCVALGWAAMFLSNVVKVGPFRHFLPPWIEVRLLEGWLPLLLLSLGAAFMAARLGRSWAPVPLGPVSSVVVGALPGLLGSAYLLSLPNIASRNDSDVAFLCYTVGFGGLLYVVKRSASRWAWPLGILGAVVIADLAVIAAGLSFPVPAGHVSGHAVLWLPGLLTNGQFGLAYPGVDQVFGLSDTLLGVPQMIMIVTGWTLGAARGGADLRIARADRVQP